MPAPANGQTDAAVEAVRCALMAAGRNRPGGLVLPVDALKVRVETTLGAHYSCQHDGEVGAALPGLIRDLHTSVAAGRDVARLLELAVLLHSGTTTGWLRVAGAPLDLRTQAAQLAQQAAQHLESPSALGLATWGGLHVMLMAGDFDLAQAELDSVTVPTNSPESMQLAGMLALSRSLLAAADSRPGDVAAPLEMAVELAERTGEGNAYWMGGNDLLDGVWSHERRILAYACGNGGRRPPALRHHRRGLASRGPPFPGLSGHVLGGLRPRADPGCGAVTATP